MRYVTSGTSAPGRDGRVEAARSILSALILGSIPSPRACSVVLLPLLIAMVAGKSGSCRPDEGPPPGEFVIHSGRIEGVALSPDGRAAASASRDGTVRVWDVATRRPRASVIRGIAGFAGVAFSPDGRALACAGLDGKVVLWDLANDRERSRLAACERGAVRAAIFSPGGDSLATGGDDGAVRLWDVASGRERLAMRGHEGMVGGLAFAPGGLTLVSAGADGRAISWDLRSGRIAERIDGRCGPLWSVALAPDGRSLALGGRDGITLRDLTNGHSQTRPGDRGAVTSVCFLRSGPTLASSSNQGAITLWDVTGSSLRARREMAVRKGRVKAMAASPDGRTLLTGSDHAILNLWPI